MNEAMIVEAIRSVNPNPAGAMAAAAPAAVADPAAINRFQEAMGVGAAAPVTAVPFADQVAATWRIAQTEHQALIHRVRALTRLSAEHGPNVAELTELQYEVANLSFQQSVFSKVADKAANAVQTLIKNQ